MHELISKEFQGETYTESLRLLIGKNIRKSEQKHIQPMKEQVRSFDRLIPIQNDVEIMICKEDNSCLLTAMNTTLKHEFFKTKEQYNRVVLLYTKKLTKK